MFLKVVGSRVESLTLQVNRHTDDTKDDLVRPRRARRRFFWGVRAGWMPGRKEGATKFQKGNLHMSVEEAGRRRPVQSETKASDVCGACASCVWARTHELHTEIKAMLVADIGSIDLFSNGRLFGGSLDSCCAYTSASRSEVTTISHTHTHAQDNTGAHVAM